MVKNSLQSPPEECPVCGAAVPRGARACPECGADERSGWDEEAARYDGLDLPEEPAAAPAPAGRGPGYGGGRLWIGVAAVLVVVLLAALTRH